MKHKSFYRVTLSDFEQYPLAFIQFILIKLVAYALIIGWVAFNLL